ncbi:MAG: Lrp/AsnC ligand binding domain-containing protein [Christiangramia sp.]|uniref:Transcriptional regulator, AsnC family n=1 Tax=Christiangramia flava JLT2011 TaxID=1229726 RepID=A0A1L7I4Q4_9FLAO|nr:Lrp/AsnC ligand binding domain-containing protein [Christiangramia flava]APU68597.1 Transcriptional regulator, AsnC family [Christiangramia flava JLT2011]MAM18313.1 transcriptional regulator [Christiangramia sp.]OSS40616.1 Transcriptional regulator, AsnC family [Christiangramia flava JLT2011]|tara:strand:+ start:202 stop:672 length:471 start_codon:yes stop_codon:yes gene_type:complete
MKIVNETVKLDGIDKTILNYLMEDAKKPILEIAKSIGITGAAVHQRLRKLEKSGLIQGNKMLLDARMLGYKTMAFVGVYLDKAVSNPQAVKQLREIQEVIECHYTTGNWSIFLKILCRDNEHLMNVLNKNIQAIEGVSRTETFISLNQQINRQIKI